MNKNENTKKNFFYDEEEEVNKKEEKIYIVPYKKYYLKVFKGDNYYLLDRYKYDVNTIMMLLDLNKINKLAEFYKDFPDGIEKAKFIEILKNELPCNLNDPMDQTNLVYGLYKFFCEVDFNGDGHIQWEEFTQFIIDTVEGDKDAKVSNSEDEKNSKIFDEKAMIKYKRYSVSEKLKDNLTHKNDVTNAVFLSKIDLIVFSEYGQRVLKLYNPKTGKNISSLEIENLVNNSNKNSSQNNDRFSSKKLYAQKKQGSGGSNLLGQKNTGYSVLFLAQYQSIVALCLSDKRILFFHFASLDRIELIYELKLPVLEKRIWYLPQHKIWVSSGSKLDKYPYFTLNELDIDIKIRNQKCEVSSTIGHPIRKSYCDKFPHKSEIMDCIEIYKPQMIVTACLDGKIRLIDVGDRDVVKIWNQHTLGVRSLNYNSLIDNAGYILSVGFEYYINVFCPDLSIDEAFKGKLEGHTAPVVSCKFLSDSYMAVSVDEEGNVRIWDTKARLCLQTIETPKKNFAISGLINLSKYNKFIVYGNKIIYYDAKYREEDHVQSNDAVDENYPIKVEYNKYYQQFFITTFRDVRVYTKDGVLFKMYKKLTANEHFETDVKIKYFLFEDNYRKFYVGFSNGAIMQFNAGNGSLIKPINEIEVEKEGIQTYTYSHTKEITSLYFYNDDDNNNENLILLSTSYDSLINVYDESNPEETEKLRSIKGGHTLKGKSLEINCLDFSKQLNLFATGSTDSLVVVWDFEMSKIEDILYLLGTKNDKLNVNTIKFLDPYALLAVAYSDGSLYIWGVKEIDIRGRCLLRTRNWAKSFKKIEPFAIKQMNIYAADMKDLDKDLSLLKYFNEESPFMNPGKVYEPPKPVVKPKNPEDSDNENEEKVEIHEEDLNLDIIQDKYKKEYIDPELDPDSYDLEVENGSEVKKKYLLIVGDILGNVKVLDLMGLIKKYKISVASKAYIRSSFNVLKKDDINAETILNHNLVPIEDKKLPKYCNLYPTTILKEFKAHNDEITCITIIIEPLCFVTSSKDKLVRIWNMNCDCLGVISPILKLSKNNQTEWTFKINEGKILEDEINEVVGIFEKVNVAKIMKGSKEDREIDNFIDIERSNNGKKNDKNSTLNDFNKGRHNTSRGNKDKKEDNYDSRNFGYDETYDKLYAQDKQKQIEGILNNENIPQIGINQLTIKTIKNMVDTKELRKKKREKKLKEENDRK